jgi:predicted PurR-regulated permease PerM
MKQHVSLLPAVTLLSVVVFGSFFGFAGVFLSVPLVIVFKIWLKELLIKDVLNNWHKGEKENPPQDTPISESEITESESPRAQI